MNSASVSVLLAIVVAMASAVDVKKRGVAGLGLPGYAFPASAGVAPHPSLLPAGPLTAAVPAVGSYVSAKGAYIPSVAYAQAPYLAKPAYATSAYAPALAAAPAYSTHAYAHAVPAAAAYATPTYAGHAAYPQALAKPALGYGYFG